MPNTAKLAGEVYRRKEGLDPEYEREDNPDRLLSTSHSYEEELTKQESEPDSPIPEYEQEQEEQTYSPAEGEGNGDNDDSDDGGIEEDDNVPSDTTERPHRETKHDTPASQQLLSESESQIQIPEVEEYIWEDNIPIQQQP